MKVLLFTHEADPDGVGAAVLGKIAFEKFDYILCETHSINAKVKEYINSKDIYEYDKIFVTDLCIRREVVKYIQNDEYLKDRFMVFDHHKSEIAKDTKYVSFIKIQIRNDKGKCCGTSMFYEYLLAQNYLQPDEKHYKFVELVRQYDTWEWKKIYNNKKSMYLKVLFDILGKENFINNITEKLICAKEIFTEKELFAIEERVYEINSNINEKILSKMQIKSIEGNKVAIIPNIPYELRNEIAEVLEDLNMNLSYVILIVKEKNSVSLRSLNETFDVGQLATRFGGKGHKEAASCPLTKDFIEYIS